MIVAHNNEYDIFKQLLSDTVQKLKCDSEKRTNYYLGRSGINLEKDTYIFLKDTAKGTVYDDKIELISGQRFPDIVAYVNENNAYGVEVKTTNSNKWKSTGSSIFEGTRVDNIKKIHLLFAKLSNPIEFRHREYEKCLYDVAITHSPRYLIDMEIEENESIFSKVGIEYNELRKLENPFKPIKKYFREKLNEGEDLWWLENNDENIRDLGVKLWANLPQERKKELMISALAYFPVLLSNDASKYARLATWLVSRFGIVNHALRDTFTAGGQIEIQGVMFPKIFNHITENLSDIVSIVKTIPEEDIYYYWNISGTVFDRVDKWKEQCFRHCKSNLNQKQLDIIQNILNIEFNI